METWEQRHQYHTRVPAAKTLFGAWSFIQSVYEGIGADPLIVTVQDQYREHPQSNEQIWGSSWVWLLKCFHKTGNENQSWLYDTCRIITSKTSALYNLWKQRKHISAFGLLFPSGAVMYYVSVFMLMWRSSVDLRSSVFILVRLCNHQLLDDF